MQSRKASLATGGGGWSSQYAENIVTGEDRKWVSHVQSLAVLSSLSGSGKDSVMTKNLGSTSLTSSLLQAAAKNISRESTAITVQVVRLMLEECPEQILSLSLSLPPLSPDPESNGDTRMETPHSSKDFLSFMQMILSVLLHGISGNQSVDSFCRLFECSCFVIKRFGFRLFNAAAGDSLQVMLSLIYTPVPFSLSLCVSLSLTNTHSLSISITDLSADLPQLLSHLTQPLALWQHTLALLSAALYLFS